MTHASKNCVVEIQLAGVKLEAYYSEEPLDGYNYTIETNGGAGQHKGSMQSFYARRLGGVSASDFPDHTELSIYEYKSGFKYISMVYIRKKRGVAELGYVMHIDFANWDLPESLAIFFDRFCKAIEANGLFSDIVREQTEYGYDLCINVELGPDDDIYGRMRGAEDVLDSLYRRELVPDKASMHKYGEDRFHWWIRYVLVPLVCSGGIAAVLVKYLLS